MARNATSEDRRPFRQAIDTIRDSGYKFQAFEQLHFTILGLFAGDLQEPLDRNKMQNLIDAIGAFFMGKHIGSIDVDFDFLRPGIFVGRPGYGDGTVVTMASESHDAIIVEYSKELAAHLVRAFPDLFPETRRRPLGGVWCNLGFFDEADFPLDERVLKAFESLTDFNAKVHVSEVALCEFTLKSLADGIPRAIVYL